MLFVFQPRPGGKNIAPVPIEAAIKEELPDVLSNVVVTGEGRKYLTCMVTVRVEPDMKTLQPTDMLSPSVRRWAAK